MSTRSETEFVEGLRIYTPNERAPDYIIANIFIDRDALTAWLATREPQLRAVVKRSQGGKFYAVVDTYRRDTAPQPKPAPQPESGGLVDDDIPF